LLVRAWSRGDIFTVGGAIVNSAPPAKRKANGMELSIPRKGQLGRAFGSNRYAVLVSLTQQRLPGATFERRSA
jgi:hypothetical protein